MMHATSVQAAATCPTGTPRTVTRTGNRKIGPRVMGTARTRGSCPPDCGTWVECYGDNPTQSGGTLFDNVDRTPATNRSLLSYVDNPAQGAAGWRFNIIGDWLSPADDDTAAGGIMRVVDRAYVETANAVTAAHPAIPAWSYTHAWAPRIDRENVEPGDFAFPVRASCETVELVRDAHARGWYAALVVDGPDSPEVGSVIDGRRVVLCPAQRDSARTCQTCTSRGPLCALPVGVVAFARHGAGSRRLARERANG